jgi:NADPH:quinone reductase-like Zn-dependent oxidoreductase
MHVITTCGKSNFDYVRSLGADAVFNSRSPTVAADIRAYTQDKLYYAWDCIGEHGSPQAIRDALASSAPEGQIIRHGTIAMKPGEKQHRDDATFTWSVAYTAGGKPVELGQFVLPAQPEHYAFAAKWLALVEKLYSESKIKMHRAEVREGGLEGVLSGLKDMKNGSVSGVKLVYRVADL